MFIISFITILLNIKAEHIYINMIIPIKKVINHELLFQKLELVQLMIIKNQVIVFQNLKFSIIYIMMMMMTVIKYVMLLKLLKQ